MKQIKISKEQKDSVLERIESQLMSLRQLIDIHVEDIEISIMEIENTEKRIEMLRLENDKLQKDHEALHLFYKITRSIKCSSI